MASIRISKEIVLRFYEEKNLVQFINLFTNTTLCQYMLGGAFDKESDAENLFYSLQKISQKKNTPRKAYAIWYKEQHIGHFETLKTHNEIELIFLLEKAFWGKGIIQTIISKLNTSFEEKLFARVMPNNTNCTKMLEKLTIEQKTLTWFKDKRVLKYELAK